MRHWLRTLPVIFLITLTSAVGIAAAETTYPKPQGHVNDFAGVMASDTRRTLENTLRDLAAQTGAEIAVVTLPSLNDEPIENVAVDLFKEWGIGKKGSDNGLLFLIAPTDHKVRIETGYGLEPILPDAATGRVLDTYVIPEFKKGDVNAGILHGTQALVRILAAHFKLNPDEMAPAPKIPPPPQADPPTPWFVKLLKIAFVIFLIFLFIRHPSLFFALMLSGVGGGGGRSSGGFGGGFGGFGGGSSGGGGSSRSW